VISLSPPSTGFFFRVSYIHFPGFAVTNAQEVTILVEHSAQYIEHANTPWQRDVENPDENAKKDSGQKQGRNG